MLELADVQVQYGSIRALHGVSLTVDPGELVALIGSNGAGKTTTLRTISGLLRPTQGAIRYDGTDIARASPHRIVELGISHCPEGRRIFGRLTVRENLRLGAVAQRDKGAAAEDLQMVLELFPLLGERLDQSGGTLSGGEQQMLAIGRALMARPRVLLLDEPSMGLAPMLIAQIFDIITEINEQGTTVLLVEQNAAQALKRAHRAYVLETGTIVKSDDAAKLLDDPAVRAAYLGG